MLLSSLAFTGKLQTLQLPTASKALGQWPDPRELKRQHPATLKAIFEEFGYKKAEQRDL